MTACPFCTLDPSKIVSRCPSALAVRDQFPLTEGHTLVIPIAHVESIFELEPREQGMIWAFVAQVRHQLAEELGVHAFNVGVNDGRAAGQTLEHAHIHVIPRCPGDVADPRGGIRLIIPDRARYWEVK